MGKTLQHLLINANCNYLKIEIFRRCFYKDETEYCEQHRLSEAW